MQRAVRSAGTAENCCAEREQWGLHSTGAARQGAHVGIEVSETSRGAAQLQRAQGTVGRLGVCLGNGVSTHTV